MKKSIKTLCILLSCFFVFSLLTGCMLIKTPPRLKERGIILAVGVDLSEEGDFLLTAQKFVPKGAGAMSAIDPGKSNNVVMEGRGKSITKAFLDMQTKFGKELFLGNNSYIIIGKDVAEQGLFKYLPFFLESYEQGKGAAVLISETTAKEITNNQVEQDIMPASSLGEVTKRAKGISTAGETVLYKLSSDILSRKRSAVIPSVKKTKTADDKDAFSMEGTYFLKGDKICDKFSEKELAGYLILKDDWNNLFFPLEYDGKNYGIFMTVKNVKRKAYFQDGRLVFDFKIKINGNLRETVGEDRRKDDEGLIDFVTALTKKEAEKCCNLFLEKTAKENGCDCIKMSLYLKNKNPKLYKLVENNFEDYLKKAKFNVSVDFELNKLGLKKG